MRLSPGPLSVSFKRLIVAVVAFTTAAGLGLQAQEPVMGKLSVDQLTDRAGSIVVATVVSRRAEWEAYGASKLIITKITLAVEQSVKGSMPGTLVIEVVGGTIGDQTLRVSDVPEFRVGDRDVLFLNNHPHAVSPVVGSDQGLFRIINESATGVPRIVTAGYAPLLSDSAAKASIALPTLGSALALDEFLGLIRDRVRIQGRR